MIIPANTAKVLLDADVVFDMNDLPPRHVAAIDSVLKAATDKDGVNAEMVFRIGMTLATTMIAGCPDDRMRHALGADAVKELSRAAGFTMQMVSQDELADEAPVLSSPPEATAKPH